MRITAVVLLLAVALTTTAAPARRRGAAADDFDDRDTGTAQLPAGTRVVRDVSYGADPAQRFDVYLPEQQLTKAPVIVMVHGGGWRRGDKTARGVVENKAAHWLPRGFVFISVNYRMLPGADALEQARDVARAVAAIQTSAPQWGGDPHRVILMGHSAGAHLVALVGSSTTIQKAANVKPFLGTVSLDSAALDVVSIMSVRHLPMYDHAFGSDPNRWRAASPVVQLSAGAKPFLAVCSSRRATSCENASDFVHRATALGVRATLLEQDLSHMEINAELGLPSRYTEAVDAFLASLVR